MTHGRNGMSSIHNINDDAMSEDFRHIMFTGKQMQYGVMSIPAGGDVGEETHKHVEQAILVQSGTGEALLDGVSGLLKAGTLVLISAGTKHNIRNTGVVPLKLITLYAPPNHPHATIHATKEDAMKDEKDATFGGSA
jgi:mannose-6-phosphate isomerase-like protein (cupin superfamily)